MTKEEYFAMYTYKDLAYQCVLKDREIQQLKDKLYQKDIALNKNIVTINELRDKIQQDLRGDKTE